MRTVGRACCPGAGDELLLQLESCLMCFGRWSPPHGERWSLGHGPPAVGLVKHLPPYVTTKAHAVAMPTSKVHPAHAVVPAETASKSTKVSAKKPAAAKAKTSNLPESRERLASKSGRVWKF